MRSFFLKKVFLKFPLESTFYLRTFYVTPGIQIDKNRYANKPFTDNK